jgi:hypothetical protein
MTQERDLQEPANRETSDQQSQQGQTEPGNATWNPGGTGTSGKSDQERNQGSDATWNPGGTGNATAEQVGDGSDESPGDRPMTQGHSPSTSGGGD